MILGLAALKKIEMFPPDEKKCLGLKHLKKTKILSQMSLVLARKKDSRLVPRNNPIFLGKLFSKGFFASSRL